MDAEAWRAADPLLIVLRRQVAIEESAREGHLQSACGALVLTLPVESSVSEQRRMRVALDLLHALWVLDRDAWRHAMADAVGVKIPASLVLSATEFSAPLTVVVSVKHDKFPWQVNSGRWATLLDPSVYLTEDEARVKQRLLQAYGPTTSTLPAIPLRLQFLVFGMATSVVQTYMTRAVDMVEAVRDRLGNPSCDKSLETCAPLMLDSLELNLSPYEMTSGIARQVLRLHALGIRFHCLAIRIIQHEAASDHDERHEDMTDRNQLLIELLDGPVDQESSLASPFSIETLVIDRADLVQFRAACTALETTRCVKNLQLQNVCIFDTPADRRLKWEWLTQAVLAPSSRTSVKHLCINQTDLALSDVAAVSSTLQAIAQDGRRGTHALQTLAISFEASNPESVDAISPLLECIGERLEALSVYLWLGTLTTDVVVAIQRSCSHLCFLDLSSVEIDSMDVFLNGYDQSDCQIRSLALHQVQVPNESVTAFARALGDPSRKASRVLRELCLDCVGEESELDQGNLDAFQTLLQASQDSPLEYLELRVAELLLSQNQSRFAMHHNTWGTGVAVVLPIASKTAFLSVCRPGLYGRNRNATQSLAPSRMHWLDPHVVSLIFQFAATRSWRTIYIDEP